MTWVQAAFAAYGAYNGGKPSARGGTESTQVNPANAIADTYGSGLDGSAWSVNFSGTQNTAFRKDAQQAQPYGPSMAFDPVLPGYVVPQQAGMSWLMVAALAGVLLWRSKRSQ